MTKGCDDKIQKISYVNESKKSKKEPKYAPPIKKPKKLSNSKIATQEAKSVPRTLRSRNAGQENEDKENFGKGI